MVNVRQEVVKVMNEDFLNRIALEMCNPGRKTLIVAKKDGFVPSIHRVNELRGFVSFNESNCCFSAVTENFDCFDCFILVGSSVSHFEQEFFRQLRSSTGKEIIEIYRQDSVKIDHRASQNACKSL